MKNVLAATQILVVIATMQIASAEETNRTDDVIPVIDFSGVPLVEAIKNLARQGTFYYILDPRVPGSTLGPGRLMQQPIINTRWENLTAQEAFDRLLASNNLVESKIPGTTLTRIAPANPGSRLIPDVVLSAETNHVMREALQDWDLVVTLRALGKQSGIKLSFDPSLSAPALGLEGEAPRIWFGEQDHITSRQAITVLLDNYDLLMIEDPTTSSARITVNTHGKTNALSAAALPSPAKEGWRTVDVGFRMTIPSNWQKEKVQGIDSNVGTYTADTATLEFDEVYMSYTAEKAQAVIAELKKKEADSKLLKPGEDIWHIDGRIADFMIGEVDPKQNGERRFSNVAELFVPYPGQSGYLSISIYYQSEQDLPTVRRVLRSIEWKKTVDR